MKHQNNFGLLRLIAAIQVMASHSIGHYDLAAATNPFVVALRMFPGVPIFFLLSGFLVYGSWIRRPALKTYARSRFLRIFPGLWACFAFSVAVLAVLGQMDGTLMETVIWIIAQMSVGQFVNPDFLRDFGVGVINGSLWSIPVEIQFYIVLPFIAIVISSTVRQWLLVALMIMISTLYLALDLPRIADKLLGVTVLPYLFMFMIGVLFAKYDALVALAKRGGGDLSGNLCRTLSCQRLCHRLRAIRAASEPAHCGGAGIFHLQHCIWQEGSDWLA